MFFYTGTEIGFSGWLFSYLRETAALSVTAAALLTSGFWLAAAGAAAGLLIAWGGFGSMVIPWAQGKVLAGVSPQYGMGVTLASPLVMLALVPAVRAVARR